MDKRFEGADGIRGLACLIVLCTHTGLFFPSIGPYLTGTGKIGVWLFFVLSAFLLTSKFRVSGFSIPVLVKYGVGRVLRIVPVFLFAALIYFAFGTAGIDSVDDLASAATFQKGFAHLWTIPVEFKFYFALPFLAWAAIQIDSRYGSRVMLLAALVSLLIHQLLFGYWKVPENDIHTYWYYPSFLMGICAALTEDKLSVRIKPKLATIVGVLVVLVLFLMSPWPRNVLFDQPYDRWLTNKFVYISFLWSVFIVSLAGGKGLLGSLLKAKPLRLLGAWSFSVYLIHWLIYWKVSAIQKENIYLLLVGMSLSVLAGAVMYYVMESPIERLRHRIQSRMFSRKFEAA